MESDLKGLGIPLEKRDCFWCKVVVLILAVAGVVAWLEPRVGMPYLVTAVLLLPMLVPLLVSERVRRWEAALGGLGRVAVFAAVFFYIAFVRVVLAPVLIAMLGDAAA